VKDRRKGEGKEERRGEEERNVRKDGKDGR
jgi:hypothetical protein